MVDTYEISYGRTNCYFSNPENTVDIVCKKMKRRGAFWGKIK